MNCKHKPEQNYDVAHNIGLLPKSSKASVPSIIIVIIVIIKSFSFHNRALLSLLYRVFTNVCGIRVRIKQQGSGGLYMR